MKKGFVSGTLPLMVIILFIWGHSLLPRDLSSQESGFLLELLTLLFGSWRISHHVLRKVAHFVEYFLLGTALRLSGARPSLLRTLNGGLLVAFMDETLQIFSGRGSSVADIWLDLSGVLVGALLTLAWRREA